MKTEEFYNYMESVTADFLKEKSAKKKEKKLPKKVIKFLIGQEFLSDKEFWERVDNQKLIKTAEYYGLKKLAKKIKDDFNN